MSKVLVIGLDGADIDLVDELIARGSMPALAALRARGSWTPLRSVSDCFAGAVWPTFFTGLGPGAHGYGSAYPLVDGTLDIRARKAAAARHAEVPAFFEGAVPPLTAVCVDVPKSAPIDGQTVLVDWGAHAAHQRASSPPELLADVDARVGRYPLAVGAQDEDRTGNDYYFALRARLLDGVRARVRLHRHLVARPWDLFVCVFSELHAAGHRFWHFHDEHHPDHDPSAPGELKSALVDLYRAVDDAVADLVAQAGAVDVVVTSGHGMRANYSARELVAPLLERWCGVASSKDERPLTSRALAAAVLEARRLVPASVRARLKHELPMSLRQRVRSQYLQALFGWRRWPQMKAFAMPTQDNCYVRVNLKGREPNGLVEPADYAKTLDELEALLRSVVDVDRGEPVFADVFRAQERYPGPRAAAFPDLVATWSMRGPVRGLRAPGLDDVIRAPIAEHRSGDHQARGFLLSAGPSFRAGATEHADAVDVAPTILAALARARPDLPGRALTTLLRSTP